VSDEGDRKHAAGTIAAAGVSGSWAGREDVDAIPSYAGAYLLILQLGKPILVDLRKAGSVHLAAGWYVYAGSAWGSGGLRARIGRHFRQRKKPHWHIDRLTLKAVELSAIVVPNARECDLVAKLAMSDHFKSAVAGFGSTDCRICESHLLVLTGA
jgi:Uri superfamily endonuclease